MNPVGIMQGRLSPPVGGRIQSFPVTTWREEFWRAREAGLDCIEWIYETGIDSDNPLRTDDGIAEIHRLVAESGVAVRSICADYYMPERLIAPGGAHNESVVRHLQWLIGQAGKLGVGYMVLPFVDPSSLRSPDEVLALPALLRSLLPLAEASKVELHLETDLAPADLVAVLSAVSHPLVRANYDIGNSASLGHNHAEELILLRSWLGSVHVKDRVLGGSTVPLGTGAADFTTCFRLIKAAGFVGPFILQAARQPEFSEVELARRNRQFIEKHLAAVAAQEQ